ncbi:zinc finger, C4 type [Teladorsagia circumcincta]|uniref:Zinc finger, C4 type n=1 Tax=Teladorsagia circumcincta TaxID=45464 RepID=A0A2G9TV32_TELCI|nr:zinc finger, C4 type [Teladorsagia circumcincta]
MASLLDANTWQNKILENTDFVECSCNFEEPCVGWTELSGYGTLSTGQNDCVIDKARRNWCPSCRLAKCFRLNMNSKGNLCRESEVRDLHHQFYFRGLLRGEINYKVSFNVDL